MVGATKDGVAEEEAGLELERWGTRFVSPLAEAAYQEWQVEQSVPFNRAGLTGGGIGVWTLVLILGLVMRPEGFAPYAAMIGTVFIVIFAALAAPLRVRSFRWSQPLTALGNALAGATVVALATFHFDLLGEFPGPVAVASYFGFAVLRVRPWQAALAAASYLTLAEVVLFRAFGDGRVSDITFAVGTLLLGIAFSTGVQIAIVTDIVWRRSYRQERIIEAQKQTIARERARSERVLKQEVSHQVAERSRELGAVLARSDVSLDVRRLSPGERFDARYRIVSALGAGGMGAVYEVERLTDGARLAMKAVVGEVSGASAARFAREAEIGARVHHEHLVSIVDVGVSSGVPFLVMELVRGGSLESQRARFGDVAWALPVLRQITLGLAALHDAGVVHRDLKPANVLLAGDDATIVAKISDFGISRFGALDEGLSIDPSAATIGASPSPKPSALTGTGMIMGTPLYMAPEAARGGRAVEAPADVFALGIIAYEMLTGRAPFAVPAFMLALAEQSTPTVAPIADTRIPMGLRGLIGECLAGDPNKRPKVRNLLAELPA